MPNTDSIDIVLTEGVDLVTQSLDDVVRGNLIKPQINKLGTKLRFIIARKWNSWYPSYFTTNGGCYAFITRDLEEDVKKNSGVIVIDPGIRFSEILRDNFSIEPQDIRSVVVSHYHPDHTMGLFELLTLTHESQYPCTYYLNKTTYDSFKVFQGKYNKVVELTKNQVVKLAQYDKKRENRISRIRGTSGSHGKSRNNESIHVRTLKTFHEEVGNRHNCLGFNFQINSDGKAREVVILGDTDGNQNYLDLYIEYLKNANIAILHIGSYSQKDKSFGSGNKHLYKQGLLNIINCINCVRGGNIALREGKIVECLRESESLENNKKSCRFHKENYFNNLEAVFVSELGLEMAPITELLNSFNDFKWFSGLYPILIFSKFCNNEDEYIKNLESKFKNKFVCYDERLKLASRVYSTQSLRSLQDFLENVKKMENGSKSNYCKNLIKINNFSIFLIFQLFYLSILNVPSFRYKKNNAHNSTKIFLEGDGRDQTLYKLLTKFDKFCIEERFDLSLKDFESFEKESQNCGRKFKQPMKQDSELKFFISHLEITVRKFLTCLMDDIYIEGFRNETTDKMESYEDIQKNINYLAYYMLKSIKYLKSFSREDRIKIDHRENNFYEWENFVESISLFASNDKKILNLIEAKFEDNVDFSNIICLVALEMQNQTRDLRFAETDLRKDSTALSRILLKILQQYSDPRCLNDKSVKFFLSDLGIELDFSEIIRIKDAKRDEWVEIANAYQSIDHEGDLIIKPKVEWINRWNEFQEIGCPDI